jgi:Ca-activated chloride channel family protein
VGIKNEFIEKVESLKYQQKIKPVATISGNELATIKFRYKEPAGEKSLLLERTVTNQQVEINSTSVNFRFVSAVAQFGMLLRNSAFKEQSSFTSAYGLAKNSLGKDQEGYRTEFLQLITGAEKLVKNKTPGEENEVSTGE